MGLDLDALTLRELVQLQVELASALGRRFQRKLALAFTDIVGSTEYFARHGDVDGRVLQQRHLDLVQRALVDPAGGARRGRVVDTAGDGAFLCFPDVSNAAASLIALLGAVDEQNRDHQPEHQLSLRVGGHWGSVLTDGEIVSGDAVNLCARVASSAAPGELRVSRDFFPELPPALRARCEPLPPVSLKGLAAPLALLRLEWRERTHLPTTVLVVETGEEVPLPEQELVTLGRLGEQRDGSRGNDIVLRLTDERLNQKISRWHVELRRRATGWVLRSVSDAATVVDGAGVEKGAEVPVGVGTRVELGGVVTLVLGAGEPGPASRLAATSME